jgi:molybdopterin-guanine dinucleotide biosynthesis protein A
MVGLNGTRALVPLSSASGIILAGGESRRMGGVNKALLKVGGQRIVERTALILGRIFEEVIVITNSPEEYQFLGLPMFADIRPGYGALGGLYTGLHKCGGAHGFLAACDMPFLVEPVIRYLVGLAEGHDVIVPRLRGHLEPLHAVYARGCIPYVEKLMEASDLSIIHFFHEVDVLEVPEADLALRDPDLLFATNLNTPEDLDKARILANESGATPRNSR